MSVVEQVRYRTDNADARRVYLTSLFILAGAAFALRAQALFVSTIDWDEGIYLVIAQNWLSGLLPYVGVWDQHPPGLPALLAVVQAFIPDPILGARLAATGAVVVTAFVIHRFCTRYLDKPDAGLIAGLLYILCISRWLGLVANTEVFNNACVTSAAYMLYGVPRRPRAVIAAMLLGVGLQIKYVVFPEAVFLCLAYLVTLYQRNQSIRRILVTALYLIVAGCFPTLIAMLYFWANGTLDAFLDANVRSNIAYIGIMLPPSAVAYYIASGLAPVMGAILIIGVVLRKRMPVITHRVQAWILVWTIAALIDVCLPVKFFAHYFFALYPPLCIAGALALPVAAANRRRAFATALVVLFVTAVPLWVRGVDRAALVSDSDAPRAVGDFLQRVGASNGSVFVYDYDPVIYALAHVSPPTPYVAGYEMSQFSRSSNVDGTEELRRVMDRHPDFVVSHDKLPSDPPPSALDEIMARRLAAYQVVYSVNDFADGWVIHVYQR